MTSFHESCHQIEQNHRCSGMGENWKKNCKLPLGSRSKGGLYCRKDRFWNKTNSKLNLSSLLSCKLWLLVSPLISFSHSLQCWKIRAIKQTRKVFVRTWDSICEVSGTQYTISKWCHVLLADTLNNIISQYWMVSLNICCPHPN